MSLIAGLLLSSLLAAPAEVPSIAREVTAAYDAGDLERLMALWSDRSPSRTADRKRLGRLIADRVELELEAQPQPDAIRLTLRDATGVLETYTLAMQREGEKWRVWSLISSEAGR
ncbi:MAG: hypothetical protein ACLGH0_11335, partial [Thermoanaerobaculia bacterium]